MSLLKVQKISKSYPEKKVLSKCSFELNKGEKLVLLGASGEGKTTLLKIIAGILSQDEGEIFFKGEKLKSANQKLIPGSKEIKLINQDFALDLYHSVFENLKLKLTQFDAAYQIMRIEKLLQITGLKKFQNLKAKDLSGGQQQRLAIARALADEPELILMDEPFNQLDFQTKIKIEKHLYHYLKNENIAAIFVTHNGIEALNWADKIAFIKNGKITRIDTPENFFNLPSNLNEATFFGSINKITIKDQTVYFRPGSIAVSKSKEFNIKLPFQIIKSKQVGWYFKYECQSDNQKITLISQSPLDNLKHVFFKRLYFND